MKQVYKDIFSLIGYWSAAIVFLLLMYNSSFSARVVVKDKYGNQTMRCYTDSYGSLKCFTN